MGVTVAPGRVRMPPEIWVIVIGNVLIALGFGLVAPALPAFARGFGVSVTAVSVLISVFALVRLVFAPASGKLVSWLGEQRVYVAGLLIVALGTLACAFAQTYWQLLLFRGASGIGSTMFTVSSVALLVRITPPQLRGRASGLWASGFLVGTITGPLVGGGLLEISLRAPFFVYAGILLVAAAVIWLSLRRTSRYDTDKDTGPAMTVLRALRDGTYRAALSSNFANGWAAMGVRTSLVPLFVTEVLHQSDSFSAFALAAFAVGNVGVLLFSGRLTDAIGRRWPSVAGLVIAAGGMGWFGLTDALVPALIASVVTGIGSGLLTPAQAAAVADVVGSRSNSGPALATFQMAADVGGMLGPVVAGFLVDVGSYQLAFLVTGAILAAGAVLWLPASETRQTRESEPERASTP